MNKTPTTLIIMDGFGLRTETEGNAVAAANTPRLDQFFPGVCPYRAAPPPVWM